MIGSSLSTLKDSGLVAVPYPETLRTAVEKAEEAWKKFCQLDENIKTKFPYQTVAGTGVGYELKKIPGSTLDVKEDFHYARGAKKWLFEMAHGVGNTEVIEFVRATSELFEIMWPSVIDFAKKMEREFTLVGFAQEVAESDGISVIRFIHYFGSSKEGDEIAKSHVDKSGFTLHLYESAPGLQYMDHQKIWREMPVSANETVIIPGMRGQYRSKNDLKGTCHRVVATAETAIHGRFSMVSFIHLINTPSYDKENAGRLQELPLGFNYEMPFGEFSKFFKKR
jgi:isopenicillin N synthase-like dioxygenase